MAEKIPNGGRKITINGTEINVLSGYNPSWEREYSEGEGNFITWDGRIRKVLEGIRFRLTFLTYGMSAEEMQELNSALKPDPETGEITLECAEFSGAVFCENYSADAQSSNFCGEYFSGSISLTASEAERIDGDGL